MVVKSLLYHDRGCLDVSLRGSEYTISSKPYNAIGKEITDQWTSEDTQIWEIQPQGFVSDKAEPPTLLQVTNITGTWPSHWVRILPEWHLFLSLSLSLSFLL